MFIEKTRARLEGVNSDLANVILEAIPEYHLTIIWGGDWKTLRDGPHFEIHLGA